MRVKEYKNSIAQENKYNRSIRKKYENPSLLDNIKRSFTTATIPTQNEMYKSQHYRSVSNLAKENVRLAKSILNDYVRNDSTNQSKVNKTYKWKKK